MKRTFIAVPVEATESLLHLLDHLKRKLAGENIRWVGPENLHLTLKFLGETSDNQLKSIIRKLDSTCSLFSMQTGKLTGLNAFSNQGNPSVLFSKLRNLPGLESMADAIDQGMEEAGFTPEQRKFRPHLTLARIQGIKEKRNFRDLIGLYKETDIQDVWVQKIVLFESILQPGGPMYKPLKTFELRGTTNAEL
jgi:RNA 2',3'-cyclic 3'-phosphodiesterase